MNIGKRLFGSRGARGALYLAPLVLAISVSLLAAGWVARAMVVLTAVFIMVALKIVGETVVGQGRMERSHSTIDKEQSDALEVVQRRLKELEGVLDQQGSRVDGLARHADASEARDREIEAAGVERSERIKIVQGEVDSLRDRLADFKTSVDAAFDSRDEATLQRDVALQRHAALMPDVELLMGRRFQQLPRSLAKDERGELLEWADRLGVAVDEQAIEYLARKAVAVEASGVGRLAASTADAIFRVLVARSIAHPDPQLLEIGVLFGLNAALLWDAVGFRIPGWQQTLIDPYEGYYGAELDRFTGLEVTRAITEINLARVGAPESSWRILTGYSTDEAVVTEAADRSYDLVFVDGDHSYEGVSGDVETYGPVTRSGGYLMIDDYGAPSWPGVTRLVDEMLTGDSDFSHLGTFSRTVVFVRR